MKRDTLVRADQYAALLGLSRNQFVESCVQQMVELADRPHARRVLPPLIAMIDGVKRNYEFPLTLK